MNECDREWARKALSMMVRSRAFEERIEDCFRQGVMRGTTHLSKGQEATQAALAMALEEGDWIVPTHRHHGHTLSRGSSASLMFSEMFGSREGLCKGLGGSMHMSDVSRWNAGSSAIVASGVPLALGLALALKREGRGRVAVALFGDGATSRGTIHECMNLASVWNLPLLFFCENNGYGMSAPVERMVSTSSIARRADGYRMEWAECDGNDVIASWEATRKAIAVMRKTSRPFFLELKTYRENGHSKSDHCVYRTREEEEEWRKKDPIKRFEKRILSASLFTRDEVDAIERDARKSIAMAYEEAYSTKDDHLSMEEATKYVFAPERDEESSSSAVHVASYREAIREALDEEMSRSSSVVMIGEDIGSYGGCFGVSGDLSLRHPSQVLETPVSEESFTGMAVGASMLGLRPVVEIMYGDFCTLASDPMVNHAAKIHFMSAGQLSCPMVLRTPMGSGTGHGSQHTQSLEGMFASIPGLTVVEPSTARDAKALLKSAIRSSNPVLFFEQKLLYDEKGEVEGPSFLLPLGKADVKREGSDVSIVSYGRAVMTSLRAARKLAEEGISAEVVDLRTLRPMDLPSVFASVRKTGRLVVVEEPNGFGGFGSAVIDEVCCRGIPLSEAPIHLGGGDCPVPFCEGLEKAMVPSAEDVVAAILNRRKG